MKKICLFILKEFVFPMTALYLTNMLCGGGIKEYIFSWLLYYCLFYPIFKNSEVK